MRLFVDCEFEGDAAAQSKHMKAFKYPCKECKSHFREFEKKKFEKKEEDAWSGASLGVAGGGCGMVVSVGVPKSEVDLLLAK